MLTFLAGLFAGGIFLWSFLVAITILLCVLVEKDEGVWATVVFIGTVLSLNFLSKVPILDYIKTNPLRTVELIAAYFAIGVAWTLIKWYFFVHRQVVKYNEFKRQFLKENNAAALTPELAAKLADQLSSRGSYRNGLGISATAPDPADHKGDLTRWGTYWPFSMVGTALNDVVRRAWEYVYEMLQTTYARISKAIFKTAEADLKMAEEYKAQQAAAGAEGGSSTRRRGN
jgi:hypothetical protein